MMCMSYTIYKTEAVILRITPHGEANSDVTFFTRELGKITARVQSARKSESKMRMHLTRYNQVMIDVVRGKNTWRLTGITSLGPIRALKDPYFLKAWHRIMLLLEHLIRGEEAHSELFDFLKKMQNSPLVQLSPLTPFFFPAFADSEKKVYASTFEGQASFVQNTLEIFGVIHVLDMLGYWHGKKLPEIPTEEVLKKCLDNKKELVAMINESISTTQIMV